MGGLFGVDNINFSSMDVKISSIHIHRAETFLVHKMVCSGTPPYGQPVNTATSLFTFLTTRDNKLWIKITSNTTALDDLLPPRRTRHLRSKGHDYILPRVRTSRFKPTFENRCLFSIVHH